LHGTSFKKPFVLEALQEGIKDAPLCLMGDQALAEFA
jgi:hypothetical protein